jgi:hypothetical protein
MIRLCLAALLLTGCADVLGIDPGLPLPDEAAVGAPDATPDSGGGESSGHDVGSEGQDSGGGVDHQDSGSLCPIASIITCGPDQATPPGAYCETTSGTGMTVGAVSPPECNTACLTYNCMCFMAVFNGTGYQGATSLCHNYLMMTCNDSNGFVEVLCSQPRTD